MRLLIEIRGGSFQGATLDKSEPDAPLKLIVLDRDNLEAGDPFDREGDEFTATSDEFRTVTPLEFEDMLAEIEDSVAAMSEESKTRTRNEQIAYGERPEETPLGQCQCEHASHFGRECRTTCANHAYQHEPATVSVKTSHGTFDVCAECAANIRTREAEHDCPDQCPRCGRHGTRGVLCGQCEAELKAQTDDDFNPDDWVRHDTSVDDDDTKPGGN